MRKGDIQENIVDAVDWPVSHNQTQTKKYAPFSVEQLNAIFHACKNDSSNYNHFIESVNTCIEQPELKFTSEHVFHSFRHTVRTEFRRNRAPEDDVCRICGWEDGSKGKTLADHYGESVLENLQETVNSGLKYDGVDLSHLYRE